MSTVTEESSVNEGGERVLRRRRSAASAALLSRPSMHSLAELVPSFETCVLVHVCVSSSETGTSAGEARLVYALFEPNFLVDGTSSSVRKLDRASWEHLRSHVEELRIVAISSRCTTTPSDTLPERNGAVRKPDCMFDLCTDNDATQRTVSHIWLQPTSNATEPAKRKDELLEIDILSPSDPSQAKHRRIWLPAQVRTILDDADQLVSYRSPTTPTTPLSPSACLARLQLPTDTHAEFSLACARILNLVQNQATPI